jgi:hypothetical protein
MSQWIIVILFPGRVCLANDLTRAHFWLDKENTLTESVENGQVASMCESSPFPQRGTYPYLTNVCQIHQSWERGLRIWLCLQWCHSSDTAAESSGLTFCTAGTAWSTRICLRSHYYDSPRVARPFLGSDPSWVKAVRVCWRWALILVIVIIPRGMAYVYTLAWYIRCHTKVKKCLSQRHEGTQGEQRCKSTRSLP